jgi:hypothetical protein
LFIKKVILTFAKLKVTQFSIVLLLLLYVNEKTQLDGWALMYLYAINYFFAVLIAFIINALSSSLN